MAMALTQGAVAKIVSGVSEPGFQPILQVTTVRNIPSNSAGGPPRWKVQLTDGVGSATAMLSTQIAQLAECGELTDNCLLQLTDFMTNEVGNTT
jgi:hypothetical protein